MSRRVSCTGTKTVISKPYQQPTTKKLPCTLLSPPTPTHTPARTSFAFLQCQQVPRSTFVSTGVWSGCIFSTVRLGREFLQDTISFVFFQFVLRRVCIKRLLPCVCGCNMRAALPMELTSCVALHGTFLRSLNVTSKRCQRSVILATCHSPMKGP